VKFSADIVSNGVQKQLTRLLAGLAPAVLDAAADALAKELEHARRSEGLHAPLLREGDARGRSVGANDPDSIAREFGSPTEPPAPWLAPVLPAARAPLRAAVFQAVARALSRRRPQ
jgi:hypothetical protein